VRLLAESLRNVERDTMRQTRSDRIDDEHRYLSSRGVRSRIA
jgi:hypothetical protein